MDNPLWVRTFIPFQCDCGGHVALATGPGRTRVYERGVVLPIPDDFPLPTCADCGETFMSIHASESIDAILLAGRTEAEHASDCQIRHIRNLERLVREYRVLLANAHAEKADARMKAAAEVTEAREALTSAQRAGDDWDHAYGAWVAAGRRYDAARLAEAAERSGA